MNEDDCARHGAAAAERNVTSWGDKRQAEAKWQVVPTIVAELIGDPDSEKSQRAMQALLGMKKLDIAALKRAYAGE